MKVRDNILVARPANGGLDVPLVFELDETEENQIVVYLASVFGLGRVPRDLIPAAFRLAERGMPQAITFLVVGELRRRGRWSEIDAVEPFLCP